MKKQSLKTKAHAFALLGGLALMAIPSPAQANMKCLGQDSVDRYDYTVELKGKNLPQKFPSLGELDASEIWHRVSAEISSGAGLTYTEFSGPYPLECRAANPEERKRGEVAHCADKGSLPETNGYQVRIVDVSGFRVKAVVSFDGHQSILDCDFSDAQGRYPKSFKHF